MDNLLLVPDIMARYKCSAPTARARMRQMRHMEKPLAVTESAVAEWEQLRTITPGVQPRKKSRIAKQERFVWIPGVSKIPGRRA